MAVTQATYTGDGGATKSFSFPSIQQSDIKVTVDDVLKSSGTHYNITGYTTTGGGNVVFTSGNIPTSPQAIKIFRETNVDVAKATYVAGSSVKAEDLNANNEQLLFKVQEDNQLIVTSEIQDGAVTGAKFADGTVTETKLAADSVTQTKIANGAVIIDKISADAVDGTKIADNSINSEHYVDGSIDTVHIADAQITANKLQNLSVTDTKLATNSVTESKIVNGQVTAAKLGSNAVESSKIADGAVTNAKLGSQAVSSAKIGDLQVTQAKIGNNAVTTDKIADAELSILAGMQTTTASNLASATALTATTAELNQLDGITLETSVTTNSDTRIPTSKAVNDLVLSVTNALGGFVAIANETSFPTANPDPSNNAGTVVSISQLASGLAVNSSGVATISNGAGTGTTVTITGFPSSLVSQTLPANSGLQVQTTSTLHTYTFHKQLASAADIQAISATVNSFSNRYRVSASAPTSSLDGGDLWYDTTNSKLMVYSAQNSAWEESSAIGNFFISTISSSSATGGGSATPNGTAYRFTISDAPTTAAACIVSVDGVIQKPNAGSSQPSEGFVLVGNDIIFGSAPANGASLFVTVIGSTVGIGTPSNNTVTTAILQNGAVTTAKLQDAGITANKLQDGSVTSAKLGTDSVVEAKIVDGNVTAAKLASNSVTTAKIADDSVTASKLGPQSVTEAKIGNLQVTTAKIGNDAVTADKLAHTSVTAGSYGSSTSIPSITVDAQGRITAASGNSVNTDLVGDTSPQLGGLLDTNNQNIKWLDSSGGANNRALFGAGNDFQIYHNGTNNVIEDTTSSNINVKTSRFTVLNAADTEHMLKCHQDGAVELYYDNSKKFETRGDGVSVFNELSVGTSDIQQASVASFVGGQYNQVNIADGSNSGWGLLLAQQQGANTTNTYTYSTNSSVNKPCSIVNVNNDALHFATNNTPRFRIEHDGHVVPSANNSYDLGSGSYRWRNIYTNDLNLSNEGGANDVDGSWGDWTIQEGESDLFLKNNRSGKKYKFNLTEVS